MTRFDDIQARHAKATPGPWKPWIEGQVFEPTGDKAFGGDNCVCHEHHGPWHHPPRRESRWLQIPNSAENIAFIAQCPDDVRWLLDRVTRLETALTDGHTRAHKQMKTATGEGYTYWQGYADACTAALDTEQT